MPSSASELISDVEQDLSLLTATLDVQLSTTPEGSTTTELRRIRSRLSELVKRCQCLRDLRASARSRAMGALVVEAAAVGQLARGQLACEFHPDHAGSRSWRGEPVCEACYQRLTRASPGSDSIEA
jgi:hypothetical protein